MSQHRTFTVFQVDARNRISFVDPGWLSFASENQAAELTESAVVGQSLWDYIQGVEIRHLYELIFREVRANGREIEIPFRCDSPTRRRFMRLRVVPLEAGELSIVSLLVREEERPHVALLDAQAPHADAFVTICSWCKRVNANKDRWIEVEAATSELDLLGSEPPPRLTHGVCPSCETTIRNDIAAYKANNSS